MLCCCGHGNGSSSHGRNGPRRCCQVENMVLQAAEMMHQNAARLTPAARLWGAEKEDWDVWSRNLRAASRNWKKHVKTWKNMLNSTKLSQKWNLPMALGSLWQIFTSSPKKMLGFLCRGTATLGSNWLLGGIDLSKLWHSRRSCL